MSIPLVQKAEKDDINTSIIAIKRNIERINMLLGLSNSEEIDTSEFVKKSDIVDEVTLDNMQSVTSNAVANYARQNLYVDCNMNGTNILVTNNLHRTDLKIEGIGFKDVSTYSYFFRTTLNETESAQTITSYNGRQLSEYDMCMINIYQDNNCIGSGIIANVVANQMSIRVHC